MGLPDEAGDKGSKPEGEKGLLKMELNNNTQLTEIMKDYFLVITYSTFGIGISNPTKFMLLKFLLWTRFCCRTGS